MTDESPVAPGRGGVVVGRSAVRISGDDHKLTQPYSGRNRGNFLGVDEI
jgi:hypothetical protein